MPVDPSIALGFQMPKLMSPMDAQSQALNLRDLQAQTQIRQQQMQQGQQTLKDQQELSMIASDRSNIDPATGGLTAEALTKLTNPMLRQKLNQDRMATMLKSKEIAYKDSEAGKLSDERKTKALHDVMENAYSTYEDILKKTGDVKLATEASEKAQREGFEDIKTTGKGGFSSDTQFKILPPEDIGRKLISHKERVDEEAKKEASDRAKETPFIKETNYLKSLESKLADLAPNDPSSAAIRKQIGEVKAHISKLDAPARTNITMAGPAITKEQSKLSGDEFLKTLSPSVANQVRAIGEGRQLLQDMGIRGAARERMSSLVNQAYPNYDSGDAKTNRAIEIDFARGKPAQSLQSINAVTEHLSTYRGLAKALDNGDIQVYNKYKAEFERATGKTLPNDLKAAAPIIGSEIVKAIVPGGGGVEERKAAMDQWNTALSKKQIESQIDNVYYPLMTGQVDGLRQRYEASGKKDFNKRFLTPGSRKVLNINDGEAKAPPKSSAAPSDADKDAVAWAKANPNDPRAKKIMEHNNGL